MKTGIGLIAAGALIACAAWVSLSSIVASMALAFIGAAVGFGALADAAETAAEADAICAPTRRNTVAGRYQDVLTGDRSAVIDALNSRLVDEGRRRMAAEAEAERLRVAITEREAALADWDQFYREAAAGDQQQAARPPDRFDFLEIPGAGNVRTR